MKLKHVLFILPLFLFLLLPSDVFASGSYNLDGACLTSSFNNTCNNFTTTYWDFAYNGTLNTINLIQVYPYQSFSVNKGDRVFVSFSLTEQYVSTGETNVWTINDPIPYGVTNDYFTLIDSRVTVLSDWFIEKDGYGTNNGGSYNSRLFTIILEAKQSGTFVNLNFRLNGSLGYYYNNIGGLKFRGYVYYGGIDYQTELLYMLVNQNSSIVSAQQGTTNAVNNIGNDITSSNTNSDSDNSSVLSNMNNKLASNSTVSSLIVMPLTLYQSVLNSVNGSCTTFTLGNLLGTNVTFPCINPANYLGSALWGVIDVLISGFFIFYISKTMVNVFNTFTSMKDSKDIVGGGS